MIIPIEGFEAQWLYLHSDDLTDEGEAVIIDQPCKALRGDGKCNVYGIRPISCRVFEVGSQACIDAILRSGQDPEEILE